LSEPRFAGFQQIRGEFLYIVQEKRQKMTKNSVFNYYDNNSQIPSSGNDTFVGILPKGISDVPSLYKALFNILLFPEWWGFNWNALYDSLRDFHWLNEMTVVLVHEDLPLFSENDIWMYLDILSSSITDWKDGENHKLIVWFPKDYKERIISVIDSHITPCISKILGEQL
jgi:hypothetical protein